MGFSSVAWRLIYAAKVSQLDVRLENQIRRFARPFPRDARFVEEINFLARVLEADTEIDRVLQVLDTKGQLLYQSAAWPAELNQLDLYPARTALPLLRSVDGQSPRRTQRLEESTRSREQPPNLKLPTRLSTQRVAMGRWRIAAVTVPSGQVAIAVNLTVIDQDMTAIRNIFLVAIPGTLLLVAGGAWWLSGQALRPIQQLTSVMQQVTATGLHQRVPIGATDVEFVELIQVFNRMLGRLEGSFKQASRFSADAAHELKTPLAILQGELEQTLQQAAPGSDQQQSLSSLLDEVRHLSSIVRKLLLLSVADAGQIRMHKVPINLAQVLGVMVEDLDLLAPTLEVTADIAPALSVYGDVDLLTQVLQNLMSNAIKYNLPNGWIKIQAQSQTETVQVTVTNASKEIPAGDRDRIFDRFYRGDPARNRKTEGIGLGLSLAREIVHAHQGSLTLDSTPAGCTAFTLTLPSHSLEAL